MLFPLSPRSAHFVWREGTSVWRERPACGAGVKGRHGGALRYQARPTDAAGKPRDHPSSGTGPGGGATEARQVGWEGEWVVSENEWIVNEL